MKISVFSILSALAIVMLSEVQGAEMLGSWPLSDSLESQSGSLRINAYSRGQKISLEPKNFIGGAIKLGDVALFATPSLAVSNGITVTGWINPDKVEMGFSQTAPHTLINLYDSKQANVANFIFRILDGKLSAFNAASKKNISTTFLAPTEQWSFFAFVLTPEAVHIYLNSYPAQVVSLENADRYDRFFVGAMNPAALRSYQGLMKNVKLYEGTLGAEEIKGLYESERPTE
ncbi:MAG: LamG-like jellyroll fold domain-containing protein [Kiritimatiellales bacterium]